MLAVGCEINLEDMVQRSGRFGVFAKEKVGISLVDLEVHGILVCPGGRTGFLIQVS
jgi:hypothetical protein